MKGYSTSNDFKKLKELLDDGYLVVLVWAHSTTRSLFSGIAKRVLSKHGSNDGDWYSLDCWSYFPTINKESFEDYCKSKGFSFILPEEGEVR